jgi:hypothetical protein
MTRQQLLRVVERSPACVAAQDRAGWLALFTRDGVVEDPVGAARTSRAALGSFYDTFIRGNQIAFEVFDDLTAAGEVVRDVVIHTRLATGLRIDVPAHLVYEVVDEDGALRIRRMRAIWDLRARTLAALTSGPRGLWTLCVVFATMLRAQGLMGVLGYARGLVSGIFARGPETVDRLAAAVGAGDPAALANLFTPRAALEFPAGAPRSLAAWLALLGPGAALRVSKAIAAGWLTAFRFVVEGGAQAGAAGVALLEFDRSTRKIARARFFLRG